MAEKERIKYIDSAKGIGIVLVCIGHAITNAPQADNVDYQVLLKFISQFHMPLFFVLSGMVFKKAYFLTPVKATIKKIRTYLVPFIVYNLVFVLLHNIMSKIYIVEDSYGWKDFFKEIVSVITLHVKPICGALWFLRSLFFITILFIWLNYLFSKVSNKKFSEYLLGLSICILAGYGISGKCTETFMLDKNLYYLPFFYLGYLSSKYDFLKILQRKRVLVILVTAIINVYVSIVSNVGISGRGTFPLYFLFLITGLSGTCMIILLSQFKVIEQSRVLRKLGTRSLDIMALHFVAFKLVSAIIIKFNGWSLKRMIETPVLYGIKGLWCVLYVFVGLVIPIFFRDLYDKVKQIWVKKLFIKNIEKNV